MALRVSLIVTDSSPLITLAVADALEVLLLPEQRVIVPDMVKHEVVVQQDRPGAQEVMSWIRENEPDKVTVRSTTEYEEFVVLRAANPDTRVRDRGERAAGEVLTRELGEGIDAAILLFEDSDIRKANFLIRIPDNVLIMSTSEYLFGLQSGGMISDAQAILDRAVTIRGNAILTRCLEATGEADGIKDDGSRRDVERPARTRDHRQGHARGQEDLLARAKRHGARKGDPRRG